MSSCIQEHAMKTVEVHLLTRVPFVGVGRPGHKMLDLAIMNNE